MRFTACHSNFTCAPRTHHRDEKKKGCVEGVAGRGTFLFLLLSKYISMFSLEATPGSSTRKITLTCLRFNDWRCWRFRIISNPGCDINVTQNHCTAESACLSETERGGGGRGRAGLLWLIQVKMTKQFLSNHNHRNSCRCSLCLS